MAMEHHYLITDNLPEVENLGHELPNMVDFDGNAYGRQEGRGMLFGTYEEDGSRGRRIKRLGFWPRTVAG